jgi:aspartyl-tRNA(Asn)/glutamyl-tRNA(Gln) amidotransferase subunit B
VPDYDIRITRVHMEEDAGKLLHEGFADSARNSYVDLNRAGTPLVEIVTEPDLRTGKDAAAFFEYLRELLVSLQVNDGNMEEGSLRCDANVSVRPAGQAALGTKAEIKNLNSFRFLEDAVEYEVERQIEVVQSGGRVVQETRLWDTAAGRTVSMRSKEEAHDYRYFPEPDLPPVVIDRARLQAVRDAIPETPAALRARLKAAHGFSDAEVVPLTAAHLAGYLEESVAAGADARTTRNWLLGAVKAKMNESGQHDATWLRERLSPPRLAGLLALVADGTISGSIAKDVFDKMFVTDRTADDIVRSEGLKQIDDDAQLAALVSGALDTGDAVAQYAGKQSALASSSARS